MIEGVRIRKYFCCLFFSFFFVTPAISAVNDLEEHLSPRGKVLVHCIAFYEAVVDVAEDYDPSLKELSGFFDENSPFVIVVYLKSQNRAKQFKKAFSQEFMAAAGDEIKEEYRRVYATFVKELETTFPNPNPEIDSSWKSCGKQGKWLHDRGIQRKGL